MVLTKRTLTTSMFTKELPHYLFPLKRTNHLVMRETPTHHSTSSTGELLGVVSRFLSKGSFTFHMNSVAGTGARKVHGFGKSFVGGHEFPTLGNELTLGIPEIDLAPSNNGKPRLMTFLKSLNDG